MRNFALIVAACGLLVTTTALLVPGVSPARAGDQAHTQHQDQSSRSQPEARYRVVFEVTSDTPGVWAGVIRNIDHMREALGKEHVRIEIVGHGGGLAMLMRTNTKNDGKVHDLAADGVGFRACENTMAHRNVSRDQLIEGVVPVDSGVAQVVRRQAQGWQYLYRGS